MKLQSMHITVHALFSVKEVRCAAVRLSFQLEKKGTVPWTRRAQFSNAFNTKVTDFAASHKHLKLVNIQNDYLKRLALIYFSELYCASAERNGAQFSKPFQVREVQVTSFNCVDDPIGDVLATAFKLYRLEVLCCGNHHFLFQYPSTFA